MRKRLAFLRKTRERVNNIAVPEDGPKANNTTHSPHTHLGYFVVEVKLFRV